MGKKRKLENGLRKEVQNERHQEKITEKKQGKKRMKEL